uniref:Si:ch211-245h14.1 n=1 Tax=Lepisosteus oculatus TaxID=7918 RepID=W5NJD0_LEPOC
VLVFCPVHSRVGADIEEATKKIPTNKNAVLVVMHHTHDPNRVLSESSRLVNRTNIVETVDCLFHETVGLLECEVNTQAIVKHNQSQANMSSWSVIKHISGYVNSVTKQNKKQLFIHSLLFLQLSPFHIEIILTILT